MVAIDDLGSAYAGLDRLCYIKPDYLKLVVVDKEKKQITLDLVIDDKICTMYEYFDIFLGRMMMCRKASELLGVTFRLIVNGNKTL